MAGKDFGGKCTLALSSGERFSLRAHAKHMPAGVAATAVVNQDGTIDRQVELKERSADFAFADRGLDVEKMMNSPRFDLTFVEEFTGVTHLFSQAFFVGEPTIDRGSGEISGMTIAAESHLRKEG